MNRSYSKIRHIQESNLKLERRLINEQQPYTSNQCIGPTTPQEIVNTFDSLTKHMGYECSGSDKDKISLRKDLKNGVLYLYIHLKPIPRLLLQGQLSYYFKSVQGAKEGKIETPDPIHLWNEKQIKDLEDKLQNIKK